MTVGLTPSLLGVLSDTFAFIGSDLKERVDVLQWHGAAYLSEWLQGQQQRVEYDPKQATYFY
jgi:hypothetical protein